jgi:hypothetical protein
MKWPKKGGTKLGYQVHYAVDGGKACIILGVLEERRKFFG